MMKELIEKIISRLEKLAEYEKSGDCPKDGMCDKKDCECCYSRTAIDIIHEEAKAYKESLLQELLKAKKSCGEDSDCSECIFGQIDDRCVLAELQNKNNNESVKTNADYIRNMTDDELANLLEDVRTHGFTDLCCNDSLCDSDGCDDCIRAWLKAERER